MGVILSSTQCTATNQIINWLDILDSNLLGVVIGAFLALVTSFWMSKCEQKKKTRISANLLYFDLESIKAYFESKTTYVNLRYSADWQDFTAGCTFLDEKQIKLIYSIYDSVYNYNYLYDRLKTGGGNLNKKAVEADKAKTEETIVNAIFGVERMGNKDGRYSSAYTDLRNKLIKEGKIIPVDKMQA